MRNYIGVVFLGFGLLVSGCATNFTVSTDPKSGGIPFRVNEPVRVDRKVPLVVREGKDHAPFAHVCRGQSITDSVSKILPVGQMHYIKFNEAALGAGKFNALFTPVGGISAVTLESDATALSKSLIEGTAGIAEAAIGILPEFLLTKGVGDALSDITGALSIVDGLRDQVSGLQLVSSLIEGRIEQANLEFARAQRALSAFPLTKDNNGRALDMDLALEPLQRAQAAFNEPLRSGIYFTPSGEGVIKTLPQVPEESIKNLTHLLGKLKQDLDETKQVLEDALKERNSQPTQQELIAAHCKPGKPIDVDMTILKLTP